MRIFVLGIRPEFLDIADTGALQGEIYGAMPTGMESTIKVRVRRVPADRRDLRQHACSPSAARCPCPSPAISIMLFDRRSGKCIASGSLEC